MVQNVTGGRQVEVFSAPEAGALRWSPDGSELMFLARGDGESPVSTSRQSSGGGARKIADGFFVGCWSPDGSTIALGLFVTGKILFLNRLGEVQRTIALQGTPATGCGTSTGRRFTDGCSIVADDEQHAPSIWTIRPDGSEQMKVFSGGREILAARWAPSGDAIYYFTSRQPDDLAVQGLPRSRAPGRCRRARYRSSPASRPTKDSASPPTGRGSSTQRRRITPTSGWWKLVIRSMAGPHSGDPSSPMGPP